jgi:hypothetical protein
VVALADGCDGDVRAGIREQIFQTAHGRRHAFALVLLFVFAARHEAKILVHSRFAAQGSARPQRSGG